MWYFSSYTTVSAKLSKIDAQNMCESTTSANNVIVETAIINDLDPDTISVVASGHRPHVNIYWLEYN